MSYKNEDEDISWLDWFVNQVPDIMMYVLVFLFLIWLGGVLT